MLRDRQLFLSPQSIAKADKTTLWPTLQLSGFFLWEKTKDINRVSMCGGPVVKCSTVKDFGVWRLLCQEKNKYLGVWRLLCQEKNKDLEVWRLLCQEKTRTLGCEIYCAGKNKDLGCEDYCARKKTRIWGVTIIVPGKKQGLGGVKIIVPRKTQTSGCEDYCARKNPKTSWVPRLLCQEKEKSKRLCVRQKEKIGSQIWSDSIQIKLIFGESPVSDKVAPTHHSATSIHPHPPLPGCCCFSCHSRHTSLEKSLWIHR